MACRGSPREDASTASDLGVVGTVMVRDVVSRAVVAHFRAHTAPLLVLQWDASGTLLVTASVHGHNINIFQVGHKPCPLYDYSAGIGSLDTSHHSCLVWPT